MSWKEGFKELTSKTHSEQAIWWLNGFWADGFEEKAEDIWKITHQFIECQIDGPVLYGSKKQVIEEDSDLDEFKSHRILEILGETLTVVALRKKLAALDIDGNKRMAISEFLINKYEKKPESLVNSPQGDTDPAMLQAAEDKCAAASAALEDASEALEKSKAAEEAVKAAEAELQAAIDEIEALEKAKADKLAKLQAIVDGEGGVVKKNKAKNEIEQLNAEDPLPLRKAKLTQNAALKKVKKARKLAEEATEAAATAKAAAEEKYNEALEALEELKKGGTGSPQGKLWWMDRLLKEKKKFSRK